MSLGAFNSASFSSQTGVQLAAFAEVEVRKESDGTLAALFSDAEGADPISNPFDADSKGRFAFYATGVRLGYEVTVTFGAEEHVLHNVPIGTAQYLDEETFVLEGDPILRSFTPLGYQLGFFPAANALEIRLLNQDGEDPSVDVPVRIPLRSVTPAEAVNEELVIEAALNITIPSTALMGATSGSPFRLWIGIFNDGSTPRLSVINALEWVAGPPEVVKIFSLDAWGIYSSTAIGTGSDSSHVFYTGSAVTSKAHAVLGYATWETGLAAAGTWDVGPTRGRLFDGHCPLPGAEIGSSYEETGEVATGTTLTPSDDTIPQVGEGDEYLDVDYNVSSAANVLELEGCIARSANSNTARTSALHLHRDATANAVAVASTSREAVANVIHNALTAKTKVKAGASGSTTLNMRFGNPTAGTSTVNGASAARTFGGALSSYVQQKEFMA